MDPPIKRRGRKLGARIRARNPIKRSRKKDEYVKIKAKLSEEHGLIFDGNGAAYDFPISRDGLSAIARRIAMRMNSMTSEKRAPRDRRYPWDQMQHGNSFLVQTPAERRAARTSLRAYLKTKECHLEGDHFMVSAASKEGYRCWLISADLLPPAMDRGPSTPISVESGHPIPTRGAGDE